jgi:hypothetical protein
VRGNTGDVEVLDNTLAGAQSYSTRESRGGVG